MFVNHQRETTTRIDAELALMPVPAMRPAQADFDCNTAIIYARAEKKSVRAGRRPEHSGHWVCGAMMPARLSRVTKRRKGGFHFPAERGSINEGSHQLAYLNIRPDPGRDHHPNANRTSDRLRPENCLRRATVTRCVISHQPGTHGTR